MIRELISEPRTWTWHGQLFPALALEAVFGFSAVRQREAFSSSGQGDSSGNTRRQAVSHHTNKNTIIRVIYKFNERAETSMIGFIGNSFYWSHVIECNLNQVKPTGPRIAGSADATSRTDLPKSMDQIRPPSRSVASKITKSFTPLSDNTLAAAMPEMPPPMMTTLGLCFHSRGWPSSLSSLAISVWFILRLGPTVLTP